MLKINPTPYIVQKYYSPSFCKGKIVTVDAIKGTTACRSCIKMRVVDVWKRPEWFDSGWFKEVK